ncbi:1,4-dihydroxy-2-naphthoate octaprenyltransferase [candidate division KSB1 bacterium]
MGKVKLWWTAVRPFAFTASVTPVLLGSSIAAALNKDLAFNWLYFILAVLGGMLVHAGTNLFNDYYDYKGGIDREGTLGSSGLLVGKLMKPSQTFKGGVVSFFLAVVIGVFFVIKFQFDTFFIGLCVFGLLSGIFYTASPVSFKYRALGDFQVFLSMGVLMTVGSYYIQTGEFSWIVVLYSIPISILVDAILHSNNLRDIEDDRKAGITTLAMMLGESGARILYYSLLIGAYVWVVLCVIFFKLHPVVMVSLLSLPLGIKLIKMVKSKDTLPKEVFAMIDAGTAQLHTAVGVLMTIGFVLQRVVF